MVLAAFPVGKLVYLAVKQVARPIANVVKNGAKRSNLFKRIVCMPIAQFYNWSQVVIKMRFLGSEGKVKVRQLSEEAAVELGSELIGEGIVFGIGAAVLIEEYVRAAAAAERKEEEKERQMTALRATVEELGLLVEKQDAQLRSMERFKGSIHSELKRKGIDIKEL